MKNSPAAVAVIFLAIGCNRAHAQKFNLDLGTIGTTPISATYSGASGQSGVWNARQTNRLLVDTQGDATDVTFGGDQGTSHFDYPFLSGDERLFMETASQFSPMTFASFRNLTPGLYDLYVYMWWGGAAGQECLIRNGASLTSIVVNYGNGQWPGQQTLGVTYNVARVEVLADGYLSLQVFDYGPADFAVVNGLQLVPVPGPGGLALLPAAMRASRRRRRS